ncbi:PREDICTED: coleoptile phototropism protein 1-like [Ipomoea nil]|uniref:coleoptile phototropism protein 1-like n=1 Tax=Ipomoea nil TaxID=35883 RepID=UPI00090088DB|nr:PREDICTED: coleoptile phototropism protein 1-like [Ipomoea nil]
MEELKMATALPESGTLSSCKPMGECWFDDACILDMDYFVKTLSGIKAKGVRPELIGSIITHYASKWLPELTGGGGSEESIEKGGHLIIKFEESSSSSVAESVSASWMKKRFFVETLIGILPPEKDSIPCNFLLRLLRIGNMVGVEAAYRAELEKRISWQLEQATLRELMIPSFSHTCGTVLDVELVLRLVKRFIVSLEDQAAVMRCSGSSSSGAPPLNLNLNLIKVAKLVDDYLAEAAVDSNLTMSQFIALAAPIPTHARPTDDALYRSIDTYLKAHPGVSKEERKRVCKLIDSRKLSAEASIHAAQNERLPVRTVIQVLLSEQTKLSKQLMRQLEWSGGSFISASAGASGGTCPRSPNPPAPGAQQQQQDPRCMSKRDMNTINIQHLEIKKLKEEVLRLQTQCINMQAQIEKLLEISSRKRGSSSSGYGFFSSWKKFGQLNKGIIITTSSSKLGSEVEGEGGGGNIAAIGGGFGRQTPTPMDTKARLVRGRTSTKWRKSLS